MSRLRSVVVAFAALALVASSVFAQTKSWIVQDEILRGGQYLISDNGAFHFSVTKREAAKGTYAGIGIHKGSSPDIDYGKLWGPQDTDANTDILFVVQADGNVCAYKGTIAGNTQHWCSGVRAPGGKFFLAMQGDGNLCEYKGTSPSDNKGLVWCSGTPTQIVWDANNAKRFTMAAYGPYGKQLTGALASGSAVDLSLDPNIGAVRFTMPGDGTIHSGMDVRNCVGLTGEGFLSVAGCNGSAAQTGWSFANNKIQKGGQCVYLKDMSMWRDCCPPTRRAYMDSCDTGQTFTWQ